MVGKSDFKENPKSDLDLDLGFVKISIKRAIILPKKGTPEGKSRCKFNFYTVLYCKITLF